MWILPCLYTLWDIQSSMCSLPFAALGRERDRHSVDSHSLPQALCGANNIYLGSWPLAGIHEVRERAPLSNIESLILVLSVAQRSDVNVRSFRRRFTRRSRNYDTKDMHRVAVKNRRRFAHFRAFSRIFHSDSMYVLVPRKEVNRPLTLCLESLGAR